MVVRKDGSLLLVLGTHDTVTAGHRLQENSHIITGARHHGFAVIDVFFANGINRGFTDDLCDIRVVDTGWTPIQESHFTPASHDTGDPVGDLANAAYQLFAMLMAVGAYRSPQFRGFRDDVQGRDKRGGNDNGID